MKRIVTFASILTLLFAFAAGAEEYGWTISDSPTNPLSNTGTLIPGGLQSLYLWLYCGDGMAAAEFRFESDNPGSNIILVTTTQNGFLNAGTTTDLLLAVGGCPTGPVVAAEILVLALAPSNFCLVPDALGIIGTVDCSPSPQVWPIQQIGYSNTGALPSCNDELCPDPTAVEQNSWGGVKGLFR